MCRWVNQLAPDLKQESFTPEEDAILLEVGLGSYSV
jgi:hypothetical protein